ncbi:MAG TPA: enolase C-terminal domain-like protein [Caldimonas sp.]|nr:enolase C-terminal domain-like protein [Caldimonas sp.]
MATAPRVRVLDVACFEQPFKLRMPFRFGVITVTHGVQAFVRARVRLDDGREGDGYAAEALGAKWFDKNPALTDDENVDQLRRSIELAIGAYRGASPATPFDLFADHYREQLESGDHLGLLPLVASFGPALLDRAVLDAVCRVEGVSFWTAMRANLAGMRPHPIVPDLVGFDFSAFLAGLAPAPTIDCRHTVGLVDPLVAADQTAATRVNDGLPETLEEVVEAYGQRSFKLKVGGQLDGDVDRLTRIAGVLEKVSGPLRVTLDGNEQYESVEAVVALWETMERTPQLQRLCDATLFIEQPIKRQVALSRSVRTLARRRPVIIDESDGDLDAFPRARDLGYSGVSSKDCKGFYKSLINLARCRVWNAEGEGSYFMSGEDLTTQAGIAVQQDLALVSLLGITHVERNGHHFIDGFAGRPEEEARAFLAAHPDLYHLQDGRVRMRIENGVLRIASLDTPGFGTSVVPDLSATAPMPPAQWPPA